MALPHQVDEDVLERALRGVEIAEADAGAAEVGEQGRDAGALTLRVVGVDELAAAVGEREAVGRQLGRHGIQLARADAE